MNIIYIYDKQFNPSFSPSPFLKPNKFKFKFLSKIDDIINLSNINICLYTEQCFNIATKHVQMGCTFRKIGWIREPPKIHIYPYNFFVNKGNNIFDKVIINNTEWLNKIPNSIYIPNMMTFLRYKDITLPSSSKKNKLVSIVCSNKSKTKGHRLRKNIINYLIENNCDVDLYGNMVNNFVDNKIDTLHNYMFQIVIENCIIDGYFSEKIIDCFLTGVIPIYWGTNKVDKFYNKNAIIKFNDPIELKKILNLISKHTYEEMYKYVKLNFEEAVKCISQENRIYDMLCDGSL